jgi:hypothetical protein
MSVRMPLTIAPRPSGRAGEPHWPAPGLIATAPSGLPENPHAGVDDADIEVVDPGPMTPAEQEHRFVEMFGVSQADLVAQGVDIGRYIHENAGRWVSRVYQSSEEKMAAGESLLPYEAPLHWIARGVTKFGRTWNGTVTVDRSAVQLREDGTRRILATSPPSGVHVYPVPAWFGMGVRLDMGNGESWYVQPRYSPANIWRARKANKVFRAALSEAGAS